MLYVPQLRRNILNYNLKDLGFMHIRLYDMSVMKITGIMYIFISY
jgi:hypothetical protein